MRPTGAVIAAATTSLPETPGGERNWDYRYSWIRDSTFALWGLYSLGFDWEANDFLYFIAEVAGSEDLQVMYGVGGERDLEEQELTHLHGYEGARPVRIGNDAYKQRQHDMWGAMLDSVYLHTPLARSPGRGDLADPGQAGGAGHHPLAGAGPGHVGGARRAEALHLLEGHVLGGLRPRRSPGAAARGRRAARSAGRRPPTRSRPTCWPTALDRRGVFTQHYDSDALDASLLLLPLVRFLPPDDERIVRPSTPSPTS